MTVFGAEGVARLGFSQAVRAGGFVFVSGQPGVDASGKPVEGAKAQALQAFANLDAVLREAGSGLDRVVRFTTLLRSMADLDAVVEARLVSRTGSPWDKSGDPDGAWQGAARGSYRAYSQGRQRRQASSGRRNCCADFWRGTLGPAAPMYLRKELECLRALLIKSFLVL